MMDNGAGKFYENRKADSRDMRMDAQTSGERNHGVSSASKPLHLKIVQNAINQFVRYWNTHKTRKESKKYLPSGVAPEEVFQHPENFGLRHAGIPVDLNFEAFHCSNMCLTGLDTTLVSSRALTGPSSTVALVLVRRVGTANRSSHRAGGYWAPTAVTSFRLAPSLYGYNVQLELTIDNIVAEPASEIGMNSKLYYGTTTSLF
ncbi:hypothetical protein B0H14DRAFT_2567403 [Mycena olivaceomarginata]|nr:hypothetical protein B0H14DRAFT_2567403 [Mycena olivaceomarginata]